MPTQPVMTFREATPKVEDIPRERLIEGNLANVLLPINGEQSSRRIFNTSLSNVGGIHEINSTEEERLSSSIPNIL